MCAYLLGENNTVIDYYDHDYVSALTVCNAHMDGDNQLIDSRVTSSPLLPPAFVCHIL